MNETIDLILSPCQYNDLIREPSKQELLHWDFHDTAHEITDEFYNANF